MKVTPYDSVVNPQNRVVIHAGKLTASWFSAASICVVSVATSWDWLTGKPQTRVADYFQVLSHAITFREMIVSKLIKLLGFFLDYETNVTFLKR